MTKEDSHVAVPDMSENRAAAAAGTKQIHRIGHESRDDRCPSRRLRNHVVAELCLLLLSRYFQIEPVRQKLVPNDNFTFG
jgi:hypothetical protein